MKPSSRYRLLMVGSIVVVLINAWLASHSLARLFRAQNWLAHTLQVLAVTEQTQVAMGQANSAARAYLLTADRQYEHGYRDAGNRVHLGVSQLEGLTSDNDLQQQRITTLRQRIAVRLGAIDAVMGMRQGRRGEMLPEAVLAPALNETPDGGISVRYALTQIEDEEHRLLKDRYEDASSARTSVILSFAGATVLDLILLVIAFQQLVNAQRDRQELAERAGKIGTLNAELNSVNEQLSGVNQELERRVEERTKELEVSNRELEAFSYSVSHDLRAPLRTIDGFSLALAEDFSEVLNEEGRDYIKRVRGGVQRMGTLIDALLQLSRVTRSDLQREPVNLSQLATLVYGELVANEHGREVVFTAEPDMVAEADPKLMRVAFENLLGNALKFTSKIPNARIAFGQVVENGETVYFIRDNGAGFDMQYVDRLFTAFQRLHGDRDFKGSGIGLATVSRIIRRHHGEIRAEGAIGAGATFYFTLNG